MNIEMFNGWYFMFLFLSVTGFFVLYILLKGKNPKIIKLVLTSLMVLALVLHFLKGLFPPYSDDLSRHLRDSWFINICGANIALFPFFLLSKNNAKLIIKYFILFVKGYFSNYYNFSYFSVL